MKFDFAKFERALNYPSLVGVVLSIYSYFADWDVPQIMLLMGVWAGYIALWLMANVVISLKVGKTDIIAMMWTPQIPDKIITRGQLKPVSFGFIIAMKGILILMFGGFAVFVTLPLNGYLTNR